MEAKLADFVNRLKDTAGENLQSVILHGSAVAGDFSENHSDLNVLCVLEIAGATELAQIHSAVAWWTHEGHGPPRIVTFGELARSSHLLAAELFDIKQHHRVLFGPDWLENFEVPLALYDLQVQRDLQLERQQLRQSVVAGPDKPKMQLEVMLSSVSRFCALFRHAVMAVGEVAPQTKRESVAAIAAWTGADPSGFEAILDLREGKRHRKQMDLEAVLHSYLEFVDLAAGELDRRLARHR